MKQYRVRVYYNSTKHIFSVQRYINGKWKLSHHTDEINLVNVEFICSHTTRLRVIREGKKYVHAYFEGITADKKPIGGNPITYNPFKFPNSEGTHELFDYPVYSYGKYGDRSVKDSCWDLTMKSPRKHCDYLSMRIIDKKPQMMAGIRL